MEAYDILADYKFVQSQGWSEMRSDQGYTDVELTSKDLMDGMNLLGFADDPFMTVNKLVEIHKDVEKLWKIELNLGHRSALALGLCRTGQVDRAIRVLDKVKHDVDWTGFLKLAAEYQNQSVETVWHELIRSKKRPDREDYVIRLKALLDRSSPLTLRSEIGTIVSEMESNGIQRNEELEAVLVRIWTLVGKTKEAESVIQSCITARQNRSKSARLAEIYFMVYQNDWGSCLDLYRECREDNIQDPQFSALRVLDLSKQGVEIKDAVEQAERETLTPLGPDGWTMILKDQSVGKALEGEYWLNLYRFARGRGTEISAFLGRAACERLQFSSRYCDDLMEIWNDVVRFDYEALDPSTRESFQIMTKDLLVSLAGSTTPKKTEYGLQLLEEAKTRDFSMPGIVPALNQLILSAPSYETGYKLYNVYISSNTLDHQTFDSLMTSFLKITRRSDTGQLGFPPWEFVFAMMKNARKNGVQVGKKAITTLIHYYGQLATQMVKNKSSTGSLYRSLENVHVHIKMDPSIEIDIALLTALMDAYNRVGDVSTAFELWNDIVARRRQTSKEDQARFYPGAIAVVMDVCAFSGEIGKLDKIWEWAKRNGFTTSTSDWIWYDRIEALSRTGQFDRALTTIQEMEDGCVSSKIILNSLKAVMKFSFRAKADDRSVLVKKVEALFPDYWSGLKVHVNDVDKPGYPTREGNQPAPTDVAEKSTPVRTWGWKKI